MDAIRTRGFPWRGEDSGITNFILLGEEALGLLNLIVADENMHVECAIEGKSICHVRFRNMKLSGEITDFSTNI